MSRWSFLAPLENAALPTCDGTTGISSHAPLTLIVLTLVYSAINWARGVPSITFPQTVSPDPCSNAELRTNGVPCDGGHSLFSALNRLHAVSGPF